MFYIELIEYIIFSVSKQIMPLTEVYCCIRIGLNECSFLWFILEYNSVDT